MVSLPSCRSLLPLFPVSWKEADRAESPEGSYWPHKGTDGDQDTTLDRAAELTDLWEAFSETARPWTHDQQPPDSETSH